MRCLYCGIKLKIAIKAQVIQLCPECSLRVEHEDRRARPLYAEAGNRSVKTSGERRIRAQAAARSL